MKSLLFLITNPLGLSTATIAIPQRLIHAFTGAYLILGALSFQYIYPRLLDKLPMLGALRKLAVWKNDSIFNLKFFMHGLLICAVSLLIVIAIYLAFDALKNKKANFKKAYLSGVVTSVPFCLGLILGSTLLLPIHHYLGLIPIFGIMATCCIQGALLRESYSANLVVSCYLIPVFIGIQFYALQLLRP